jgi:hypothetical protein
MTGLQIFQILKAKIGERESEALLSYVDTTLKDNRKELYNALNGTFASKEDLAETRGGLKEYIGKVKSELKEDIAHLKGELKEDIANLKGELKEDIANVKGELSVKIANVKSDVIRWVFALFITMLLAILGLYLKK